MNRGDRRERIFRDNADRQARECGIETLGEVWAKTGGLHASLDFKVYDALEDLKRTPDDTLLYAGRDVG